MKESLLLTLRSLVRGKVLFLLMGAVALIHWLAPGIVRSDGSAAGAFEMYVRTVPGFVSVVVQLTVLSVACGLFAGEREEKRLALTMTRPVPAFSVAIGKWIGMTIAAALTLAFSSVLLACFPSATVDGGFPPCRHHYAPSLPPPEVVAGRMLDYYLQDPQTPEAVKKASKSAVLTLLTTKEQDRYDVVKPGESMSWPYETEALKGKMAAGEPLSLLVRFSTQFSMRSPVAGSLTLGEYSAVVSNNTQSYIEIPLSGKAGVVDGGPLALKFSNTGKETVMLRPRRDLEVLAPADSFWMNLLRAQLEVLSLASLLAAYGIFLSAALSRPVAVFTAITSLAVVMMVPSVIIQFPDEFHASLADRIGLAISRCVQMATSSISMPSPISDLATGRAVEWRDLLRMSAGNFVVLPFVLLVLASFIVRRKPLADK